jgi:putative endonuclease
MIWLTRLLARSLGTASKYFRSSLPEHLHTARWGEMEAYFYLRSLGYRIVARNYRSAREHGEIDLIGWDDGALCFIEVKTHSKPGLVPPEIAVDAAKKSHIRSVARRYVQKLRTDLVPTCRFDVVSVVLEDDGCGPTIRLHKGAFSWKTTRFPRREFAGQQALKRWWK